MGVAAPSPGSMAPPVGTVAGQRPQPLAQSLDHFPRTARQLLTEIIRHHGPGVCDESKRCEEMLNQDYRRDVGLLMLALNERIPQQLQASLQAEGVEMRARLLTSQLVRSRGLSEEHARYAVESWAIALRLMVSRQ
jgi:hypothetical protein